ncbi:UDP-glycosyltransferase 88F4 [Bienertia sinuspersici]
MKRLLEQRKAEEISLTDEEIYVKLNLRVNAAGGIVVREECEKIRKEVDKAMNEAAEAKNEAISANEENKVKRHYLEKFLNTLGYKLFEFNMDEDFLKNLMKNTAKKKTRMKRK